MLDNFLHSFEALPWKRPLRRLSSKRRVSQVSGRRRRSSAGAWRATWPRRSPPRRRYWNLRGWRLRGGGGGGVFLSQKGKNKQKLPHLLWDIVRTTIATSNCFFIRFCSEGLSCGFWVVLASFGCLAVFRWVELGFCFGDTILARVADIVTSAGLLPGWSDFTPLYCCAAKQPLFYWSVIPWYLHQTKCHRFILLLLFGFIVAFRSFLGANKLLVLPNQLPGRPSTQMPSLQWTQQEAPFHLPSITQPERFLEMQTKVFPSENFQRGGGEGHLWGFLK